MHPSMEMPKYQCYKKVWALKIVMLESLPDGHMKITPAEPEYAVFTPALEWGLRFHGRDGDLGYYVVYEDGYASWSPSKAFEDGYSLIASH